MWISRLEWCAAAEPRLLDLKERWSGGRITEALALLELGTLVGSGRFMADWAKAQKPCPKDRGGQIYAMECFEAAHPRDDLAHRLYSIGPNQFSVYAALALELGLIRHSTAEVDGAAVTTLVTASGGIF